MAMYTPPKFAVPDADVADALARAEFAHLVTHTPDGLVVTPLPMLYDAGRHSLIGHVARANPHWQAAGEETVAIFAGPQAYVSPSLYATKAETGKVVPTWNYDVLTAYGRLAVHDDEEWVRALVTALTDRHERNRTAPWAVTDAPEPFVRGQLHAIVGVELVIERVEAKAKMSQNQTARNRAGVAAGLADTAPDVAHRVAELDPGSTNAKGLGKPSPDSVPPRTSSMPTDRSAPDDGS
jgi:transcriptional regulator